MKQLFSSTPINVARQSELDLARGLAVVFMVFVHVQESFMAPASYDSSLPQIIDWLGEVPAAPVFMFLLGVGINYSRKTTPSLLYRRGLMLFLGGYILSILRGVLPNIILWFQTGNDELLQTALSNMFFVDILQFAGLTMLFFGFVMQYKIEKFKLGLIALIFALLNILLSEIPNNHIVLAPLSGLVWGANELSFFPFLTWIIYPIAGYIWGWYLIRCVNKPLFYRFSLVFALIILIAGLLLKPEILELNEQSDFYYYHHTIIENIVFTAFVIVWICLIYHLTKWLPGAVFTQSSRWSCNVTAIYFAQWILIGWMILIVDNYSLSFEKCLLISFAVFIISDGFAMLYSKLKTQ